MHQAELDPAAKPKVALAFNDIEMVETIDPQRDLADIRNIRATLVNTLRDMGVMGDTKLLNTFLTVLKDMDSSALAALRLKVDSEKGTDEERNRALASEILRQIHNHARSGTLTPTNALDTQTRVIPDLPDSVVTREFVPGEMTQGTVELTFDDFQRQHGAVAINADTVDED